MQDIFMISINLIFKFKTYNNASIDLFFCKHLHSADTSFFDATIPTHKLSCSMDVQDPTAFKMELYKASSISQSRNESVFNFPPLAASQISFTLSCETITWLNSIVPFIADDLPGCTYAHLNISTKAEETPMKLITTKQSRTSR